MTTSTRSRSGATPVPAADTTSTSTTAAGRRFWLTDERLSVADHNRALARYSRSARSLMG